MQSENFFHISTKEQRKKEAKKERRKVTAATAVYLSTFFRTGGNVLIEELIEFFSDAALSSNKRFPVSKSLQS